MFPKGAYNNMKVKKINSSRIKKRFGNNAYEVELLEELDISGTF